MTGYSPWGRKESDLTEQLTLSLSPVSSYYMSEADSPAVMTTKNLSRHCLLAPGDTIFPS